MSLLASAGALCFLIVIQLCYSLPCGKSGYCSVGKLEPFVGSITAADAFRAAADARSYKNELIVMVVTSHRMLPTLQTIANLQRLGLEHILMISTDSKECIRVAGALPTIGCVWDNFQLPMIGEDIDVVVPVAPLWHIRWRTMARAMRLGYNVLVMDSDVIVFDDPYRYLKSPPFSEYVILDQPEVLYHQDEYQANTFTNGGIVYIQNARPDGPAAWLVAEVSDRLLRWVENNFTLTRSRGMQTWCCYLDQDCFTDALSSVQTGRPFWHWAINVCTHSSYKKINKPLWRNITANIDAAVANVWSMDTHRVPKWMESVVGSNTTTIKSFAMKLPNYQGIWPAEYGGKLYPDVRGNLSTAFLAQLTGDCNCSLWPDPEDASPSNLARWREVPNEKFGFMPPWMVLGYFPRGRLGYWSTDLLGSERPQQVIGHAHYIPDTDASIGKNVMKMLHGHYDWALADEVTGGAPFFANQHTGAVKAVDSKQVVSVPRLLAVHPSMQLNSTNGWEELQAILIGMAQAAVLSGRTLLWPDIPCSTPWINERSGRIDAPPLDLRQEWMPHGQPGSLMCTWLYVLLESCMFDLRGMLPLEYTHYHHKHRLQHALDPADDNTAFSPGTLHTTMCMASRWPKLPCNTQFQNWRQQAASIIPRSGTLKGIEPNWPLASRIVVLRDHDALTHLSEFQQEQIVYVAHPIQIVYRNPAHEASFNNRFNSCQALSHWHVADLAKNDPFRHPQQHRVRMHAGTVSRGKLLSRGLQLDLTGSPTRLAPIPQPRKKRRSSNPKSF